MTIGDEYKQLVWKKSSSVDFFVPLFRWVSGDENNIEVVQNVNFMFAHVDKEVLNRNLNLNNKLRKFIKFPKVDKDDEKTQFFYKDLAHYFGWTIRELKNNLNVINIDEMKPLIASKYGYESKERKILGLKKCI